MTVFKVGDRVRLNPEVVEVPPEPKIIEGWINVYRHPSGVVGTSETLHLTEQVAIDAGLGAFPANLIGRVAVKFTEGDGL
jgi:hypothetical protein